jgi:hypothetical protein
MALSEYGRDDRDYVRSILFALSKPDIYPKKSLQRKNFSRAVFNANKIIIEVAINLKFFEFLVKAANHSSNSIRMMAAQGIGRAWNQDTNFTQIVIRELRKHYRGMIGLPRRSSVESLLTISLLIAFNYSSDAAAIKFIQELWIGILDELLILHHGKSQPRIYKLMRDVLIRFLSRIFVGLLKMVPPASNFNLSELADFVKMEQVQRLRFLRLIPYMNPYHGNIDEIRDDLLELAKSRSTINTYLAGLLLTTRGNTQFSQVSLILDQMFDIALRLNPPSVVIEAPLTTSSDISANNTEYALQAYRLFEKFFWQFHEFSNSVYRTRNQAYQRCMLDRLIIGYYEVHNEFYSPELIAHLDYEKAQNKFILHRLIVGYSDSVAGNLYPLDIVVAKGYPRLALKIAQLLIDVNDDITRKELYKFLAKMRRNHQELVDDFIEEFKLSSESVREEEALVMYQTIGDLAAVTFLSSFPRIQSMPPIYSEIQALLNGAASYRSLSLLIDFLIKRVVNFIYGSSVFDLSVNTNGPIIGKNK